MVSVGSRLVAVRLSAHGAIGAPVRVQASALLGMKSMLSAAQLMLANVHMALSLTLAMHHVSGTRGHAPEL